MKLEFGTGGSEGVASVMVLGLVVHPRVPGLETVGVCVVECIAERTLDRARRILPAEVPHSMRLPVLEVVGAEVAIQEVKRAFEDAAPGIRPHLEDAVGPELEEPHALNDARICGADARGLVRVAGCSCQHGRCA